MYRSLLEHAVRTKAQLVVTPEYSVPWKALDDVIGGKSRPLCGALWALGCESITPDELDALRVRVSGTANVRLFHEQLDPAKCRQRVFVDPLVYIFWAWDESGADVLCILVQFKTAPSRDPNHIELRSLNTGEHVYKFNHNANKIALIGILCSEAFDFTQALVDEHHQNLLLLHLQLNPRPAHPDYTAYRRHLFSVGSRSNVEVLCLNWAAGVLAEDHGAAPWLTVSGSAWYVAPSNAEVNDDVVNSLHRAGVYYSLVERRWHGFYLNYAHHVLLVRKQRVFISGHQALAQRLAPEVVERCSWSSEPTAEWAPKSADDGFASFISGYAPVETLVVGHAQDPLSVERALELLSGPRGNPLTWFAIPELEAMRVAEEESMRRVTVSLETDASRAGVAFRRQRARSAQAAATLQQASPEWPRAIADLATGFRFRWAAADPHCNVVPLQGAGDPATLVYLGENPETDLVSNMLAQMTMVLRRHAAVRAAASGGDMNAAAARAIDRLCVAYKKDHKLVLARDASRTSIAAQDASEADDIAGEGV